MVEPVVPDDALLAAGPVRQSVDGLQVRITIVDPTAHRLCGDVGGAFRGLYLAFIRCGVIRKHAVIDIRLAAFLLGAIELEFLLILEDFEQGAHGLGAIAGFGGVLQAQAVGLHLVLTAVALQPGLGADVGEIRHRTGARHDGRARCQHRGQDAPRLRTSRMTGRVVTDLVAENRGELRFGIQIRENAAVHVDVAPANSEGVHRVLVEDEEFEVPGGQRGVGGDFGADLLDVILDGLVFVEAVDLNDLSVNLAGVFLLTLGGREDDVMAAGRRIGRAAGDDDGQRAGCGRQKRQRRGCHPRCDWRVRGFPEHLHDSLSWGPVRLIATILRRDKKFRRGGTGVANASRPRSAWAPRPAWSASVGMQRR